jgi:hypothetical protein
MRSEKLEGAKVPIKYGLLDFRILRQSRRRVDVSQIDHTHLGKKQCDHGRNFSVENNFAPEAFAGASAGRFEHKSRESVPTDSRGGRHRRPQTSSRGVVRCKKIGLMVIESVTIADAF